MKNLLKVILVFTLVLSMGLTAMAASTYIIKDGVFQNAGFINAGEVVGGTIQGPGNWTQLNGGEAAVEVGYLHIVLKCTGDTALAAIKVNDTKEYKLADLGITLTEEYQDVVLPVQADGLATIGWLNLMGLDGGSTVYTVKDVFMSDSATSSLAAAAPVAAEGALPATGGIPAELLLAAGASLTGLGVVLKKRHK